MCVPVCGSNSLSTGSPIRPRAPCSRFHTFLRVEIDPVSNIHHRCSTQKRLVNSTDAGPDAHIRNAFLTDTTLSRNAHIREESTNTVRYVTSLLGEVSASSSEWRKPKMCCTRIDANTKCNQRRHGAFCAAVSVMPMGSGKMVIHRKTKAAVINLCVHFVILRCLQFVLVLPHETRLDVDACQTQWMVFRGLAICL